MTSYIIDPGFIYLLPGKIQGFRSALLNSIASQQGLVMVAGSPTQTFMTYQILNSQESVQNAFWAGGTTGYVYVHRNYLINSLKNRIAVKYSATAGTGSNGHYPPRFCHLEI